VGGASGARLGGAFRAAASCVLHARHGVAGRLAWSRHAAQQDDGCLTDQQL